MWMNPVLFLVVAIVAIPLCPLTFLRNYMWMGASIFFTLVEMMVASGPIINGLVEMALTLPKKLATAVTGVLTGLADKVEKLIESILGGVAGAAAGAASVAGNVAAGGVDLAADAATGHDVETGLHTGGADDKDKDSKSATKKLGAGAKMAEKTAERGTHLLIHETTHAVLHVVNPIVKQAAALLDIKDFLPKQFFDFSSLGPPVGIVMFVFYFMYVWPTLLNMNLLFLPAELPIMHVGYWLGTFATCGVMLLLVFLALTAHKFGDVLLFSVQLLVNHAFRAILDKMMPTEKFDKPFKLLGEKCPKPSDFKELLLDMCYLDFMLDADEVEKKSAAQAAKGMLHAGVDKSKEVAHEVVDKAKEILHIKKKEEEPEEEKHPDNEEEPKQPLLHHKDKPAQHCCTIS